MCQAAVYLDGKEIMRDVLRVELLPDGLRLSALFEEPRIVPSIIREIDFIKHRIMLESPNQEQQSE